jgi:signal transduction histidine kinase/CheY-like chemotaxis protein
VRRTPSISRVFAAAFLAIAVAAVAGRVATWRAARRTQADMIELSEHLERLDRFSTSPALKADVAAMQELVAEVGDEAINTAVQTTIIFAAVLVALAVGLWYNRRRLERPFAHVLAALARAETGHYDERLDEDQPEEFGRIARGVNRMAAALGWRERIQDQAARLLTALNAPHEPTAPGEGFGPALGVLAWATGAPALALYQPHYDTNEWAATAVLGATTRPLARDVVRALVADATNVIQYDAAAAGAVRGRLQLAPAGPAGERGLALVPLRSRDRLVGLLVAVVDGELSADARSALEHAAPNLAIACERESAHQHMRRLAAQLRHAAQLLESQNAKLAEQHGELSRLNTALDQASRLKDQFLANMSHELRTPLNSVIGFSDLLVTMASADTPLTDTQRDYVETISRNGRHLLELINELLDLSKIAAGRLELRLEPLELEPVLREAADSVRAPGRGDRRPGAPAPGAPEPPVQRHQVHDRRRPHHAPGRAGRRGARAHRRHGHGHRDRPGRPAPAVSGIRATRREPEPPLRRHGPRPRALEAAGRTARRCHRRREPARPGQYVLVHRAAGRAAAAGRLMATIVVVEDQPDSLKLITALLTMNGHRVVGLASGEELVPALQAAAPPPALVLLDIQLPGRDGFSVLADVKRLAGAHPWKLVALTAHAMPGDRERALAAGFDGYITKPIDVRSFPAEVARYLPER